GLSTGSRCRASAYAGGAPCSATARNPSPSRSHKTPNLASQRRVASASKVSNTRSSLPGELEITRSTSEVAVCCSRDSLRSSVRWRSSLSRRVFSMAMTAWAAKFRCRFRKLYPFDFATTDESEHDRRMIAIGLLVARMLRDFFKPRLQLEAEILILRHQLNI